MLYNMYAIDTTYRRGFAGFIFKKVNI